MVGWRGYRHPGLIAGACCGPRARAPVGRLRRVVEAAGAAPETCVQSVLPAAARGYALKILFIDFPLASSSTSLSRYRIFCINGSSTCSTRTPHTTPVINDA